MVELCRNRRSPTVIPAETSTFGPEVRLAVVFAPFVRTVVLPAVKTRLAESDDSYAVAEGQTETSSELPSSPGNLATQSPTPLIPDE